MKKISFVPVDIANVNNVATIKGFEGILQNTISAALALAGIALFIMLILGGFRYLTSGGNQASLESARKTITYAVFGFVALALGYLILVFIEEFTGAKVTVFEVFRETP